MELLLLFFSFITCSTFAMALAGDCSNPRSTTTIPVPKGSWFFTARNATVERLDQSSSSFLLKAELETTSKEWKPGQIEFERGQDLFVNHDGKFLSQEEHDAKLRYELRRTNEEELNLLDIVGAIIPPFNILLAGHLKKRLVQTKRELVDVIFNNKKSTGAISEDIKPRINHDRYDLGVLLNGREFLAAMVTPFNLVLVGNLKKSLGQTKHALEKVKEDLSSKDT